MAIRHPGDTDAGLAQEVSVPQQTFPAPTEWAARACAQALAAVPAPVALAASGFLRRTSFWARRGWTGGARPPEMALRGHRGMGADAGRAGPWLRRTQSDRGTGGGGAG